MVLMLRGSEDKKIIIIIFMWEKNVLNKIYVSWGSKHVCFKTFSEKRKKNELRRKYTLFGGPAGNLSPPTILHT